MPFDVNIEATLNIVLSVLAIVVTIIGCILSGVFYYWGRKEQKDASESYHKIAYENNMLVHTVDERINNLSQTTDKLCNALNKSQDILQKSTDKTQEMFHEFVREVSKQSAKEIVTSMSDKTLLKEVKDIQERTEAMTNEQIKNIGTALSQLNDCELSVLYCIWKNRDSTINSIANESSIGINETENSMKSLKGRGLIDDFNAIKLNLTVLDELFDVDDFSGMRFAAKINTLKEAIRRIPKIL